MFSQYENSITTADSRFLNIGTNVNATNFQQNLQANGFYLERTGMSKNGPFTVLGNGTETYTIYTRSSTSGPGAMYPGVNGEIHFTLGGW